MRKIVFKIRTISNASSPRLHTLTAAIKITLIDL